MVVIDDVVPAPSGNVSSLFAAGSRGDGAAAALTRPNCPRLSLLPAGRVAVPDTRTALQTHRRCQSPLREA